MKRVRIVAKDNYIQLQLLLNQELEGLQMQNHEIIDVKICMSVDEIVAMIFFNDISK